MNLLSLQHSGALSQQVESGASRRRNGYAIARYRLSEPLLQRHSTLSTLVRPGRQSLYRSEFRVRCPLSPLCHVRQLYSASLRRAIILGTVMLKIALSATISIEHVIMWFQGTGKILILVGAFLSLFGLLLLFWQRIPFLRSLPGDITVHKGGLHLFLPLGTCLLVSILLTIAVNFVIHLLR